MGSKKKVAKKGSDKRRAKNVLKLAGKAKAEVDSLLTRAGTQTQGQLKTGLREVKRELTRMLAMVRHFL